jgi:hypothetical protein
MNRAPFHWTGDLSDLNRLMKDTFELRMGGGPVADEEVFQLGKWLNTIPALKPSVTLDSKSKDLGLAAFVKGECSSCHIGGGTKEGGLSDIGTGEAVRAPDLVGLSLRAPYLHTGEVPTIRARVMGALHPQHGDLSRLNGAEKEQLVEYLESL